MIIWDRLITGFQKGKTVEYRNPLTGN